MKNIIFLLLFCFATKAAVHINQGGLGEVLLLPFYTVNNGLNTLVTVSNTTEQVKAVKIIFKEGYSDIYGDALSVYLAPNDVWSFGLIKSGHQVQVISHDLSCSPFFNSPMTLTDGLADPTPPNLNELFSEGMIEIYEMGELDPSYGYGEAVTFENGMPRNCALIEESWDVGTGKWGTNQGLSEMLPPAGGMMASVFLLNVSGGVNYSYDAIALSDFYPDDTLIHARPWSPNSPSLADAVNISMVQYQGDNIVTEWLYGFEAVSALLSKQELIMDYSNELSNNAQTEVIISFPTKRWHLGFSDRVQPFFQPETIFGYCERFNPTILDRDSLSASYVPGNVSPVPPHLCSSVNVIKIWDFYATDSIYHPILGSENITYQSVVSDKEGMYKIKFNQVSANGQSIDGSETHTYFGLPVIGLYLVNYTNANAQPGLLAQYGGAFMAKSSQNIEMTSNRK